MSIEIVLPFPDSHLMPNAARRLHWRTRATYAQTARLIGKVEMLNHLGSESVWLLGKIPVEITFCEPNKRPRDLDGMLSALKPTLDGLADAIEIDDKEFEPIMLRRGKIIKGGKVVLRIG